MKDATKHTRGKWVAEEQATGTIFVHNGDGSICTVPQVNPRGREDARLIAAAPQQTFPIQF